MKKFLLIWLAIVIGLALIRVAWNLLQYLT